MVTVETYLRQQYANEYSEPSMESGLEEMFGKFMMPSLFSAAPLSSGPWNDPSKVIKLTPEFLKRARYKDVDVSFQTPVGSWLWQAGQPLTFEQVIVSLDAELLTYVNLMNTAWPIIREYTRWAVRVTNSIETVNLDEQMSCRPKTVAEVFSNLEIGFIGMEGRRPLTVSVPFKDDVLTTLRIQQRPDHKAYNYMLQLDADKAIKLFDMINQFDRLASGIDDKFVYFSKTVERLKSFRELARTDEPDHPIYKFLDREMMGVFNHDLHCAMFNRATSISNHLRMQIYCSAD